MRLKFAAAIFCTSAALTAAAITVPASAEVQKFDLSGFTRIEADAAFIIEFTQAPTYSVVIDSKNNNFDMITVEKVGDTLRITRPKEKRHDMRHIEDIVRISAPDLESLKLEAAIEFNATKLNLDKLTIDANAAIQIHIKDLRLDTLKVDMDAASELVLGGSCNKLILDLGAASEVDTRDFKCREVDIDAGVASDVRAYASERANAHAGMSSNIRISGKPAKFKKSTGRFGSEVSLVD